MKNKKCKILLVEDEKDAAESITSVLTRRDFKVMSTGSGIKAIEWLEKSSFDLILLDLDLEDITGIEVLEKIRVLNETLKVIVITGSILVGDDRNHVCSLGIHKFLTKPSTSDQLLSAIDEALNNSEYLLLSEFPIWQFEPTKILNTRHELKGILGVLNLQCSNFLFDMESGQMSEYDEYKKYSVMLAQFKEVSAKVRKACEVVNKEIIS